MTIIGSLLQNWLGLFLHLKVGMDPGMFLWISKDTWRTTWQDDPYNGIVWKPKQWTVTPGTPDLLQPQFFVQMFSPFLLCLTPKQSNPSPSQGLNRETDGWQHRKWTTFYANVLKKNRGLVCNNSRHFLDTSHSEWELSKPLYISI